MNAHSINQSINQSPLLLYETLRLCEMILMKFYLEERTTSYLIISFPLLQETQRERG